MLCKDRDYQVLKNLEVGPGDVGLKIMEIISRPLYVHVCYHIAYESCTVGQFHFIGFKKQKGNCNSHRKEYRPW